jgi:hypothetical protein
MRIIPLFDTGLTFDLFWVQIRAITDNDKVRMLEILDSADVKDKLNKVLDANGWPKLEGNRRLFCVCCDWVSHG